MSKYDQQERIERYLAGELPPAERQVFEQHLAADEALRRDVELYRQAAQALDNPERLALRELLQDITGSSLPPARQPWWRRWWLAAVLLTVLAGGWWWWAAPDPALPPAKQPSPVQEQTPAPADAEPAPADPPVAEKKAQQPIAQADAFRPNASWETMVSSQVRGAGSLQEAGPSTGFKRYKRGSDGNVTLRFNGSFTPESSEQGLLLSIYNNRDPKALYSSALPVKDGAFDFRPTLKLAPGIYYYTFDYSDSGDTAGVGKFIVQ